MITNLFLTNPISSLARLLTAALLAFAMTSAASAQQSFKTPEEAVEALATAAKAHDRKSVLAVLGPDAADIVLRAVRAHALGRDAAVIGVCSGELPGSVVLDTGFGRRLLTEPDGELLPRIC